MGANATYGPITAVHDSELVPLGTRYSPDGGKTEFIYLKGVASTVAEDLVVYDENFATVRTSGSVVGPVAVAMAAVVANKYGWYQIYGNATVDSATVAADKQLFLTSVSGRVDDVAVTGDLIIGMVSTAADTSNSLPVRLNYPYVTDVLG